MIAFRQPQLLPQIQSVNRICHFILVFLLSACSDNNQDGYSGPDPALGPKPVLWNLGVDFDATFTPPGIGKQHLKFFEFGWETEDSQTGEI